MDESKLDQAFEERTPLLEQGENIDIEIEKPPEQQNIDDFDDS
jgi:hypothetical protein